MADNEQDLTLKDAIWFAQQLGNYSPEEQTALIDTKDYRKFEKIAGHNSGPLWKARTHWIDQAYQGVKIPIAPSRGKETQQSAGKGVSATGALTTGAGLGLAFASRNAEYNNFKKSAKKYAEEKATAWEESQKKKQQAQATKTTSSAQPQIQPNPRTRLEQITQAGQAINQGNKGDPNWGSTEFRTNPKNPDARIKPVDEQGISWANIKTKEEAYALAYKEAHDRFVLSGTESAGKWAKKHKDQDLSSALEGKRILDEQLKTEWNSAYTPTELQDPKIQSTINAAIRQRLHPNAITSKGTTEQTAKTVFANTTLDSNDPKQRERIFKLLGEKALSGKEQTELLGYHPERIIKTEMLLGRKLDDKQRLAILKAHYAAYGASGKTGGQAGAYNYTQQQIAQKTQILKEAGFDREQRRKIIEAGIAGVSNPIAPNTLSNIGAPNVLREAQAPATPLPPNTQQGIKTQSEPHDKQTPTTTPQEKGFRKRLSSFGPRAIAREAKTRFMDSRLGKRLSSSKLGKFAGKVKRFGNKVSGIKRKINKFISPLDYFSKLLKRSIITSVASALSAALSAMATAATVLLTSLIAGAITAGVFAATAISKIIIAITGTITTIVGALAGPQIIVVIVVALIIAIAAILFGPAAPGRSKQYSPYPGIVYSINSEYPKVANGQNIKYKIIVLYDPNEAKYSLDKLLLVDTLPPGTTLIPKGTTGIYDSTSRPGTIIWKLSKNTPTKNTDDGISYDFDLILDPQDDLTVENKITIETGDLADNPGGGDLTGLYEGADSPPSNNTCGEYAGVMNDLSKSWPEMGENTNFGDPVCSYKPEKFNQLLEKTETKTENISFWKDIVSLEGAIMTVGNLRDGDGKIIRQTNGPFGKFQMSRSTPPGKKWKEVSPRGDTTWQKQIENAVGYNKSLAQSGNNFGYWGSAMCLCWWPKYRTQSYCKDIVSKGPSSTTGPRAPAGNSCPTNTGLTCNTAVRCENDKASEIGKRGPRQ